MTFAIGVGSAWDGLGSRLPSIVVYADRTAAMLPDNPKAPVLPQWRIGKIDSCLLDGLTERLRSLAAEDFGQTGIMDGSFSWVSVGEGYGLQDLSVENLSEVDSSRLNGAQRAARKSLIQWLADVKAAITDVQPLPIDRIRVVLQNESAGSSSDTVAVAWQGQEPWLERADGVTCGVLTGSAVKTALSSIAASRTANDAADDDRVMTYRGLFRVAGVMKSYALTALPPHIGCSFR